ncbi:SRPBCC family protein [Photobacterium sanctipauli]|uniref:SRPBCC family protein n=1 Tax=Photobacterium sanctipauli TaxID=1342794 RepID=A0A2T3NWT5_9GAMM|nr:SRPBCC family protein [Photobacterium sanctipauli]PSW20692.1 SRPBCC family protein [Photobacterium sanctipauli]
MYTITINQTAKAPKKILFKILSDHANLGQFFGANYQLIKEGKPNSNGIGAVRQVSDGLFNFQEQIIDYKENEHLQYTLLQGSPAREYGGWITFQSLNATQSQIHYQIKFTPRVKGTGWLMKYFFKRKVQKALSSIANYSEEKWQG